MERDPFDIKQEEAQDRFNIVAPSRSGGEAWTVIGDIPGTIGFYQQTPLEESWRTDILRRLTTLEERVQRIDTVDIGFLKIELLPSKNLKAPLDIVVEPDNGGFIARMVDVPLYGYGDDPIEAIDALKDEIETLYDDLMEDDNLSRDWLRIKSFLKNRIVE